MVGDSVRIGCAPTLPLETKAYKSRELRFIGDASLCSKADFTFFQVDTL